MNAKSLPADALVDLRRRLSTLPARCPERRQIMRETAATYGVSEATLYRAVHNQLSLYTVHRVDRGTPRVLPQQQMKRYCEVIAAMKVRTMNKRGRHLSTAECIRLLEEYGVETPEGALQAPRTVLKKTTINRYLKLWGYDQHTQARQPPAVRFEAQYSNACWHFDLSPSDLKHVQTPAWVQEGRGHPLLMLYSVVDDRSGVAYQEYHSVYGEDVEAALRFLFAAMSPKPVDDFPFQGIPAMLYMDNGPIARSQVFQQVIRYLGVEVRTHLPQSKEGRRVTARAKGKVERPFRTVKEMHETLYHFHAPQTAIKQGKLVALSGIAGCGKTTLLHRLQEALGREQDMIVSKSLAVDKDRVNLGTLIMALFYDVSIEKDVKIPTQPEKRERQLLELIHRRQKAVVLFVDEAHDFHSRTLLGLKRLMELVRASRGILSVVLAGHPKLTNDLHRSAMEEIGARATIFTLTGVKGHQRDYILWLLEQCTGLHAAEEFLTDEALTLLADRLTTPLQIEHYLTRAFEEGSKVGQRPITSEVIEGVLAHDLESLEPRLVRHG